MNPTHLHLLLNHIPILGSLFGLLILLYGILIKNRAVKNIALWTFVFAALFAIPVFLTGEPAEESVENLPGINEAVIETHEEGAEAAIILMEVLGALSLVTWFFLRKETTVGKILTYVVLVLSLVTFGIMAKVGNDGGKIRHTELTNGVIINGGGQDEEKDDD